MNYKLKHAAVAILAAGLVASSAYAATHTRPPRNT